MNGNVKAQLVRHIHSQVLAQRLDELFEGLTSADVRRRPGAPDLMIAATDMTTGAPFDFAAEPFELICSDLGRPRSPALQ